MSETIPPDLPADHDGRQIVWAAWNAHVTGAAASCGRSVVGQVLCKSCGLDGGMWKAGGTIAGEPRVHAMYCEWCGELTVAVRCDPPPGKWVGRFETIHHVPSRSIPAPIVEG